MRYRPLLSPKLFFLNRQFREVGITTATATRPRPRKTLASCSPTSLTAISTASQASSTAGSHATSFYASGHVLFSPNGSMPTTWEALLSPVVFSSSCRRTIRHAVRASQAACPACEMAATSSTTTSLSSRGSKSGVGCRLEKSLMAKIGKVAFKSPSTAATAALGVGPAGRSRSSGLCSPSAFAISAFGRRVGSVGLSTSMTIACRAAFSGIAFDPCRAAIGLSAAISTTDGRAMGRTNGRHATQSPKSGTATTAAV